MFTFLTKHMYSPDLRNRQTLGTVLTYFSDSRTYAGVSCVYLFSLNTFEE